MVEIKTIHTKNLILYPLPYNACDNVQWSIVSAKEYQIVGSCGLISITKESAEVWYTIARGWRGQGFACETLKALLAYGFEALLLETIDAVILESNTASHTVAHKAGMHQLALLKNQWYEHNALHNVLVYRLSFSDYCKQK